MAAHRKPQPAEKKCRDCEQVLPADQFHLNWSNKRNRHYLNSRCKACRSAHRRGPAGDKERKQGNERNREKYRTDPAYRETIKERNRVHRFGVDSAWVDQKLAEQGGGCAICGTTDPPGKNWHIDHDHACCDTMKTCGKCLRGVLCHHCNVMLAMACDQPERLEAGVRYLMFAGISGSGAPVLQGGVSRMNPVA